MFEIRKTVIIAFGAALIFVAGERSFKGALPISEEAPAGYTTPPLNQHPGVLSTSNGIPEPSGDTFALDQSHFEELEGTDTGLGPLYNAASCGSCHQSPVTGGSSQVTELRAGHLDASGNFADPVITINDGRTRITGRSVINDRATCAEAQEHVPASEAIRSLRISTSVLGDGFVEAVPDEILIALAKQEAQQSGGTVSGDYVYVPITEAPGHFRIGRFGWKDQHASLLSFTADAYLDEMGVTSRLNPIDTAAICKNTPDIEDRVDSLGMSDIDHFVQFIRGTQAPPRDASVRMSGKAQQGEALFAAIGCQLCHTPTLATAAPGTVLNGGAYVVSDAIGNKLFHPYSDFLLHDVGTGDGIVQRGPQDTAQKMRTGPLWGLRTRNRYLHDGRALTLDEAIEAHSGESAEITKRYHALKAEDQKALLVFLSSL